MPIDSPKMIDYGTCIPLRPYSGCALSETPRLDAFDNDLRLNLKINRIKSVARDMSTYVTDLSLGDTSSYSIIMLGGVGKEGRGGGGGKKWFRSKILRNNFNF